MWSIIKHVRKRFQNLWRTNKQQPVNGSPAERAKLLRGFVLKSLSYFESHPLDVSQPIPAAPKRLLCFLIHYARGFAGFYGLAAETNKFSTDAAFSKRNKAYGAAEHTHFIAEGCGHFAHAQDTKYCLLTSKLSYCVAITFYNPKTQHGGLVHFAYENTSSLWTYLADPEDKKLRNLQHVLCKLLAPSQPVSDLRCTLTSGDPTHLVFYEIFLMAMGVKQLDIFCHKPWSDKENSLFVEAGEDTVQLDCKTGIVSHPTFQSVSKHTERLFSPTSYINDVSLPE